MVVSDLKPFVQRCGHPRKVRILLSLLWLYEMCGESRFGRAHRPEMKVMHFGREVVADRICIDPFGHGIHCKVNGVAQQTPGVDRVDDRIFTDQFPLDPFSFTPASYDFDGRFARGQPREPSSHRSQYIAQVMQTQINA